MGARPLRRLLRTELEDRLAHELLFGALKKGGTVALIGFGTFSVSKRKAREGRNPKTGEAIKIAARKAPKFSAGKGLKDALN